MKKAISAKEAKEIDRLAREKFGISALILMENAGRAVAEEAFKAAAKRKKKIAIFCGGGNNGGDGFCAARHLMTAGISPDIYLAAKKEELKGQARANMAILLKLGKRVVELNDRNINIILNNKINKYSIIIDALFGIGLKGQLSGVSALAVRLINNSGAYIISVDVPSGLEATGSNALGCCVRADETVTFIAKKSAMLKKAGRKRCGKVKVRRIGFPL